MAFIKDRINLNALKSLENFSRKAHVSFDTNNLVELDDAGTPATSLSALCWHVTMTASLTFLPQKSVNQRPTVGLLYSSLVIENSPREISRDDHRKPSMT